MQLSVAVPPTLSANFLEAADLAVERRLAAVAAGAVGPAREAPPTAVGTEEDRVEGTAAGSAVVRVAATVSWYVLRNRGPSAAVRAALSAAAERAVRSPARNLRSPSRFDRLFAMGARVSSI